MTFLTVYLIGIGFGLLATAILAGIAGESDPNVLGPFATVIVMWPLVLAAALFIAPFVGAWFVGDWIRRRFHS